MIARGAPRGQRVWVRQGKVEALQLVLTPEDQERSFMIIRSSSNCQNSFFIHRAKGFSSFTPSFRELWNVRKNVLVVKDGQTQSVSAETFASVGRIRILHLQPLDEIPDVLPGGGHTELPLVWEKALPSLTPRRNNGIVGPTTQKYITSACNQAM